LGSTRHADEAETMPTITRGRGRPRPKPPSEVKGSRGPRPDRRGVLRTSLPGDPTIRTTVPTEVGEDNARFEPTGEPDEAKVSSPVRRGAAETGPHGNRADRPPYVRRFTYHAITRSARGVTRSMCPGRPAYLRSKGRTGGSSRPKLKVTGSRNQPGDRVASPDRHGQGYTASSQILSG
jgi:hypothetical protein